MHLPKRLIKRTPHFWFAGSRTRHRDLWLKMSAIVKVALIALLLISGFRGQRMLVSSTEESAKNATSCHIDSRVSMLRCISVSSLDLIGQALDQWNLTSITRLEISRISLQKVQDFSLLPDSGRSLKFKEVSIVNCGLESLGDRALDGLDFNELESIDLSWNELIQVPAVVLRLTKLRHLDLSHNKIFSLPPGSSFNNLNALATLKLSGNR